MQGLRQRGHGNQSRWQSGDRLLRAGYYQILTYGKPERWFAYWDIYRQPQIKPKLSVGWEYWWVDADKASKLDQAIQKHQ